RREAEKSNANAQLLQSRLTDAQREIASRIATTEKSVNSNINQYRSDTTSAVGKLLRPPRKLTAEQRTALIANLKRAGSYSLGIRHAEGSLESQQYLDELLEAVQ